MKSTPPQPRERRPDPTLSQLIREVEVAAKFSISRDELSHQLGVDRTLMDALIEDTGIELR
jgi:hypothetical protein